MMITLLLLFACLSLLNQDPASLIAYFINTWNGGTGILLNFIFVKPLEIAQYALMYFTPLYNAFLYFVSSLLKMLFMDVIQINLEIFAKIVENIMLFFGACGLSLSSWTNNVADCLLSQSKQYDFSSLPNQNVSVIPWTQNNMNCIGNDNYMMLDFMTPSLYARNLANNFNELFATSCPGFLLPINIAMYPLLDYNFYMSVHTFLNAFAIHPVFALPLKTWRRCEFGKTKPFTTMEKAVMCVPDFTQWFALLEIFFQCLGKLLDNWLNSSILLIEAAMGIGDTTCSQNPSVARVWADASHLLGSSNPLQTVGLTESLYAVTDGLSTVYQSTTHRAPAHVGIGNFPFRIDPRLGVAAVHHREIFDADDEGSLRTGMLGCRCVDLDAGISLQCAAVPYLAHVDPDNFEQSSTIQIKFDPADAAKNLRCASTLIKISSLRFSRKRFSFGGENGVDHAYNDVYDVLGLTGKNGLAAQPQTFTADAAIYVMPKCDVSGDLACLDILSSCFPFCLGLHTAGSAASSITLHNAQYWTDFVNIAQTECSISFDKFDETCIEKSFTYSNTWDGITAPFCNLPKACVPLDFSNTALRQNLVNYDNKIKPSIRLEGQPFVFAGDVMLINRNRFNVDEEEYIDIVRLYDNNRGDYTLQNEELALASNGAVQVRRTNLNDCLASDDNCHIETMKLDQIVLPPADKLEREFSHPVTSSQWAVHWAVNPDNSVMGAVMNACQSSRQTEFTLDSSYGPARVWTLKYTRASDTNARTLQPENRRVSFMTVPNWMNSNTQCNQQVNMKVVDLEYLNSENILITVLQATPADYNWLTGSVCEGCPYAYERYFLHPNSALCVENRGEDAIFSCWRHESAGMFLDSPIQVNDISKQLGSLCPAVRRMPEVGKIGASLAIASKEVLKWAFDLITVFPPVFLHGTISELLELRLGKITFHTTLDSSGSRLLDVNNLNHHMNRIAFLSANSITKAANLFSNLKGYEYVEEPLIGTAKIAMHLSDTEILSGPLLSQLENVKAMPSIKIFSSFSALNAPQLRTPRILTKFSQLSASFASNLQFNLRFFRRTIMRILQFADNAASIAGLQNIVLVVLYESLTDFNLNMLDGIRISCDGMANILYTNNPVANVVREGCLIFPDAMENTYNAFLLLTVEYPILSCVCKIQGEDNFVRAANEICMNRMMPVQYKYEIDKLRKQNVGDVVRQDLCFALMDSSNSRLEKTFDAMFSRIYKFTQALSNVLNYVTALLGFSDEGCASFVASPYVVTILPDPIDYFQGCSTTSDCRSRCYDSVQAFESTYEFLANTGDLPHFAIEDTILVNSEYFVAEDVEEGLHVAPFAMFDVMELDSITCLQICNDEHYLNRCLYLVGHDAVYPSILASAYYCVPANFMTSVYAFSAMPYPYINANSSMPPGEIVSMHILTNYKIRQNLRDAVLTVTKNEDNSQMFVYLVTHISQPILLLTAGEDKNRVGRRNNYFKTIEKVFVLPGTCTLFAGSNAECPTAYAHIIIKGQKLIYGELEEELCQQLIINTYFDDSQDFLNNIQVTDCPANSNLLFLPKHIPVCHSQSCEGILMLPYDTTSLPTFLSLIRHESGDVKIDRLVDNAFSIDMQAIRPKLQKLMVINPSEALYATKNGVSTLNFKRMSRISYRFEANGNIGVCSEDAFCLMDLFFVGGHETTMSWLHSLRILFDSAEGGTVNDVTNIERKEIIKVNISCSISNCLGCNMNPPDNRFIELQGRCFAAEECTLRKCIGTEINMRKPLCNLGKVVTSVIDMHRITLQNLWTATARMIILLVELSEKRRQLYAIDWFDTSFMAVTCQAKDTLVESIATLTSISGLISYEIFKNSNTWSSSRRVDATNHAITVMATTAFTKLFTNVGLFPLYGALVSRRIISCSANDTVIIIQNLLTDGEQNAPPIKFEIGNRDLIEANGAAVGFCVSETVRRDLKTLAQQTDPLILSSNDQQQINQLLKDESNSVLNGISRRLYDQKFGSMYYPAHGLITWALGVVSGIEDVIQTVDYTKCKAPLALRDISKCVCDDIVFEIPQIRKNGKNGGELWCMGPLLFDDFEGNEFVVWNPFTLEELLSNNYDAYINCLSLNENCVSPVNVHTRFFEARGVDVLQVITRCRANYMQKQWDAGSLLLGLFNYDDWQSRQLTLHDYNDLPLQNLRRQIFVLYEQQFSNLNLNIDTWLCLHNAVKYLNWNHGCAREMFVRNLDIASLDAYFVYSPQIGSSANFAQRDACKALSGQIQPFANNNAAVSPLLWNPSASYKVPVTILHDQTTSSETQRLQHAKNMLEIYHANEIAPLVELFLDYEADDNVDVSVWSYEADEIHQSIDCVMMGPYASADMRASFMRNDGTKFPVPQYHRGDPTSRAFELNDERSTSGSQIRQSLISKLLQKSALQTENILKQNAKEQVDQIRNNFRRVQDLYCICQKNGITVQTLECCLEQGWTSLSSIDIATESLLDTNWNLEPEILESLLNYLTRHDILTKQVWTDPSLVPENIYKFNAEERRELLEHYVFKFDAKILHYDESELDLELGSGTTLWHDCTSLLSASFFTLSLNADTVDGNFDIDLTESSPRHILHKMEDMVEGILSKARTKSPVFWTHMHRYVASDSLWCEDFTNDEIIREDIQMHQVQTPSQYEGESLASDYIVTKHIQNVNKLTCHCGWVSENYCQVLPAEIETCWHISSEYDTAWMELCDKGLYSTREDYFLMLRALLHNMEIWMPYCLNKEDIFAWGLMTQEQSIDWWLGNTQFDLDVHHLASFGPSGLRYGLLGQESNSLFDHVKQYYRPETLHSPYNFKYNHTIAQPVCESSLRLSHDLRNYFLDVFVPMAHSVHEAPVSAYCTAWVLEYALYHTLQHLSASQVVIDQHEVLANEWKSRCRVQLEQLGICLLRDVFDLKPDDRSDDAETYKCSFDVSPNHGCSTLFYITDNCLVMCDHNFYDPCQCNFDTPCTSVVFVKSACSQGRLFDIRSYADDADIQTLSLNWPDAIQQAETLSDTHQTELNNQINEVKDKPFDVSSVFPTLQESVTAFFEHKTYDENSAPAGFCDDLFDYWPSDAQHPVGYHPTCSCDRIDTNMRGFVNWMSQPLNFPDEEFSHVIEPVRFRNMTEYSSEFGASQVMCTLSHYGKTRDNLNPFFYETLWDASETMDLHMPTTKHRRTRTEGMNERGANPLQDSFETPVLDSDPYLRHSAGLIRNWLRADDASQQELNKIWPHWFSMSDNTYATAHHSDCKFPQQHQCTTDVDCMSISETLMECKKNADDVGICVVAGTCFAHEHCRNHDELCSGDGYCVPAEIFVENSLDSTIDVGFSATDNTCLQNSYGLSRYQGIASFASDSGMCNFRDWNQYLNWTTDGMHYKNNVLRVPNHAYRRTNDDVFTDLKKDQVMAQLPHACDRSYEHMSDFKICLPPASLFHESDVYDAVRSSATQTRLPNDDVLFCNLRQLTENLPISGFLYPYKVLTEDSYEQIDTLKQVSKTIGRCLLFETCPASPFQVDTVSTTNRIVYDGNLFRSHRNSDTESCGAHGVYRVQREDCIVDQLTNVLAIILFYNPSYPQLFSIIEAEDTITPSVFLHENNLQRAFDSLILSCPDAFENNFNAFYTRAYTLLRPYSPEIKDEIKTNLNALIDDIFGNKRGFETIDEYLKISTCAQYIVAKFDTFHTKFNSNVYVALNPLNPPKVGRDLYFFASHTAIALPFAWYWQCVIASGASEGGVFNNWKVLLGETSELSCPNYDVSVNINEKMTVKRRLQTAPYLFNTRDSNHEVTGLQLFNDIQDTLSYVIDELKLTNAPDHFCIAYSNNNDFECSKFHPQNENGCWSHAGRDTSQKLSESNAILMQNTVFRQSMDVILGNVEAMSLATADLKYLQNNGVISQGIDLKSMVSGNTIFFPSIRFLLAEAYVEQFDTNIENFNEVLLQDFTESSNEILTNAGVLYATKNNLCQNLFLNAESSYELKSFEHSVLSSKSGKLIGSIVPNFEFLISLTTAQALYLAVRLFLQEIANSRFFALENLHVTWNFDTRQNKNDVKTIIDNAFEFNEFMKTKRFPCGDSSWNPDTTTNDLHKQLQTCVNNLKVDIGWLVPPSQYLQIRPNVDGLLTQFLLHFTEHDEAIKFLDQMTSDDLSKQSILKQQICYNSGGNIASINPFWATSFDIESGCDLEKISNVLYSYDSTCLSTANTNCEAQFPSYHAGLQEMPSDCFSDNVVTRLNTGSLPHDFAPCNRIFDPTAQCANKFGALFGSKGNDITSLEEEHEIDDLVDGIWSQASRNVFFSQDSELQSVRAMRLNPWELGGSVLHFRVQNTPESDSLILHCINLYSIDQSICRKQIGSWLPEIDQKWNWQHTVLSKHWSEDNLAAHWSCPIQWINAISNYSLDYHLRSPSWRRNEIRFHHITNPSTRAHPTVQSVYKVSDLQPAWFMSEIHLCTAPNTDRMSCRSQTNLQKTLSWLRTRNMWKIVELVDGRYPHCDRVLDWPHLSFRLYDGARVSRDNDYACNIIHRTNNFAFRISSRSTALRSIKSSIDVGGVCRMGRLKRISAGKQSLNRVQKCRTTEGGIYCLQIPRRPTSINTNSIDQENFQEKFWQFYEASTPADVLQFSKNRPCALCQNHEHSAFHKSDNSYDLRQPSRRPLSVGKPRQFHPSRQLANHLRASLCNSTNCDKFKTFLPDTDWTKENFISAFLKETLQQKETQTHVSDDLLWSRPWLFCSPDNNTCVGSLTKEEWTPPKSRAEKCVSSIMSHRSPRSTPIQFCKIDVRTRQLCEAVTKWNNYIKLIYCQLLGLSDCPVTGFFYTPTAFSVTNDEFVSSSVVSYYQSISSNACTRYETTLTTWDNRKCPAHAVTAIRMLLELMRKYTRDLLLVGYYFMQSGFKLIEMIVQIFEQNPNRQTNVRRHVASQVSSGEREADALDDAKAAFVLYWKIIIQKIVGLWEAFINVIYEIVVKQEGIFQAIVHILQALCEAYNFVIDLAYSIACQFVDIYWTLAVNPDNDRVVNCITGKVDFFDCINPLNQNYDAIKPDINDLGSIPRTWWANLLQWDANAWKNHLRTVKQFYSNCHQSTVGIPTAKSISSPKLGCIDRSKCAGYLPADPDPDVPGCLINARNSKCACENLIDMPVRASTSQPLPQPTRCWATYQTYFGDTQPLSCTSQDTCANGLSADPIQCFDCPKELTFGRKHFGCDPIRKQCSCSVPIYESSYCSANVECSKTSSSNCRFLDSSLTLSSANIPCSSCSGRTMCFVENANQLPFCVCALHDAQLAACPEKLFTESVFAGFNHLCLLARSPEFRFSALYEARYDDLEVIPCMQGNPGTSYCYRLDANNYYVVLHSMIGNSGRRLLSEETNTVVAALTDYKKSREYILHDSYDIHFHHRNLFAKLPSRHLTDFDVVLEMAQYNFEKLADLQNSFAQDVMTVFRPDYLPLSDSQAIEWMHEWPPRLIQSDEDSCALIPNIFMIFANAMNNVSVYYAARHSGTFQKRPANKLRNSWPTLLNANYHLQFTPSSTSEDFITKFAKDGVEWLLDLFSISNTIFLDALYSITNTAANSLQCDYENIQMCHRWKVNWFNGLVIVSFYFIVAYLVAQSFGMAFLVIPLVPFFGFFHMNLCYGYEWSCFPMIPNCLLEDVVASLNATIPAKIDPVPRALLRADNAACSSSAIRLLSTLPSECIVKCHDAPYFYNSIAAPLAWWLSEFDLAMWTNNKVIPLLPYTGDLQYHLLQKHNAQLAADNLILHRTCAILSSYKLIPVIILLLVLLAFCLNLTSSVIQFCYSGLRLIASVFVDSFS